MSNIRETLSSMHSSSTSCELLMTSVPPPTNASVVPINNSFECAIPLKTRSISWPNKTEALCLHCAGQCNRGPCLPAVKYFDPQQHQYWVYGPFCCSSCVYAHICEKDNSKQLTASHYVLREYFGLSKIHIGPPRAAHKRFGGPLDDSEFYNTDSHQAIKDILMPPFVTFAHYVMAVHEKPVENTYDLLPQSAGRLIDLQRPSYRNLPLASKTETGQEPLILNYIAQLTENSTQKKRPRENEEIHVRQPTTSTGTQIGFLSRYMKKTE